MVEFLSYLHYVFILRGGNQSNCWRWMRKQGIRHSQVAREILLEIKFKNSQLLAKFSLATKLKMYGQAGLKIARYLDSGYKIAKLATIFFSLELSFSG